MSRPERPSYTARSRRAVTSSTPSPSGAPSGFALPWIPTWAVTAPGDAVAPGQSVVVLESMKMELHVNAPFAATVVSVRCAIGDMVERGAVLAEVAATEDPGPA